MSPLALYWWKAVPNFGDAMSAIIVAHMSGRDVVHRAPPKADAFAIGSLMQVVRKNYALPATHRPVLWGTGMLGHVNRDFLANVDVALLRGPISAALLGLTHRSFGDPGLLISDIIQDRPARQDVIGLIPHHSRLDDPELHQVLAKEPRLKLIHVGDDPEQVCKDIASCAHVIASSLHGLIVADAFGVPSTWLDPVGQSHLKYYDYAASVGRSLRRPIALPDVPEMVADLSSSPITWSDGVEECREALRQSFPQHLCASEVDVARGVA